MNTKKIGEFIAYNRKKKGLTQEDLGDILGVSNKTVSRWENGNYMPDLSLLKPLSEALDITLNELLTGEKIAPKNIEEVAEKILINTLDYTRSKIANEHKKISLTLMVMGVFLSMAAFLIFDKESSWCAIYSIIGIIIFIIGVFRELRFKKIWQKTLVSFIMFVSTYFLFIVIDFVGVVNFNRPPIYRYIIDTSDIILYKNIFYNVYRINPNTKNEYYIVDTKKKYTKETVPQTIFNRSISGIDNIKKYQNKYIGNNSNIGNLVNNLPLSEFGYVIKIDSENKGLIISYNTTDWYHNNDLYITKGLIYNSVSIFTLIENVTYIKFNFSGSSYEVSRNVIENNYPNYYKIIDNNKINEDNFNKYVENKLNDDVFVQEVSSLIFEKK